MCSFIRWFTSLILNINVDGLGSGEGWIKKILSLIAFTSASVSALYLLQLLYDPCLCSCSWHWLWRSSAGQSSWSVRSSPLVSSARQKKQKRKQENRSEKKTGNSDLAFYILDNVKEVYITLTPLEFFRRTFFNPQNQPVWFYIDPIT